MYLFFDTETIGLPKNWKAPVRDLNNWPRVIQLAYLLYSLDGKLIEEGNYLIKPEGFKIPVESIAVHGITNERAEKEGEQLSVVLKKFYEEANNAEFLVAHNMSFDEKVLGAEFLRIGMKNPFLKKKKICTMIETTDFCRIKGKYGKYKWPSLSILHKKLFDADFEDAHDAKVDTQILAKCFWELKRLGEI